MVIHHKVEGYKGFCKFMENLPSNGEPVYLFFSGSALPSGESWCSDCVQAKPIVERVLEKATSNSHFVYISVGDRSTWKDLGCPFRKDPRTRLMVIPTLIKWQTPQKLEGEQCEKPDLVELILSDDD